MPRGEIGYNTAGTGTTSHVDREMPGCKGEPRIRMKPLQRLGSDVPLVTAGALSALLVRYGGVLAAEHPASKQLRKVLRPSATILDGGIAVMPVEGMLARKPDAWELLCGVEDTSALHNLFNELVRSAEVKGIVLDIDSPGGFVTGGPEFADAVRQATKTKPVVAFTGGTMASLAYYIGSQANAVIATRSAQVGCIGVFTTHIDLSQMYDAAGIKIEVLKNQEGAFKAMGILGTSLTKEQREHLQERMNIAFRDFRESVTRARPQVQEGAMRGQVLEGKEARNAGLIDSIGDLSFAVSTVRKMLRDGQQFQ